MSESPVTEDLSWSLQLLEALPDGVAYMKQYRFAWVNEALVKLIGVPREKVIGMDARDLLDEEEVRRVMGRYQARLRGETPTGDYEIRFRRGDGTYRRLRMEPRLFGTGDVLFHFQDLGPQERERKLLTDLGALTVQMQSARDVDGVLDAVTNGLRALDFEVALVELAGEGQGRLCRLAASPEVAALGAPLREGPVSLALLPGFGEAMQSGRPAYVDDPFSVLAGLFSSRGETVDLAAKGLSQQRSLSKLVVAPITQQGSPWGLLLVSSSELGSKDAAALSLLAAQLSSSLEVARQMGALERQNLWLSALQDVVRERADLDVATLLRRLIPAVRIATGSESVAFYLRSSKPELLELLDSEGFPEWFFGKYRQLPIESSVTGTAVSESRIIASAPADYPPETRKDLEKAGFKLATTLPLFAHGGVLGALVLARREARPFSPDELRAASMVADHVGIHLERARLYADLQRSYDSLSSAQKELVKRERLAALGELAAVLAHEVRNPLGVMFNSLASLKRLSPSEDARPLLEYLTEEASRLDRLVSDLLDFARPHEPVLEPEPLAEVVSEAVEAIRRSALPGETRVALDMAADLPPVLIDARMIRQALVNLLLNAVQATPKGGEVRVAVAREQRNGETWARIDVSDAGPGVAPELADRIFQPFFTTRAAGTGLGLALVKRIVDAHRAEIAVQPRKGGGTTFSVWLRAG